MLLKHSISYLFARGLPGLVNVAALAVYTRMLAPDVFGRYALIVSGTGLANVVVFQWLRLVLARFFPAHRSDPKRFLSGILAIFLKMVLTVMVVGSVVAWWLPEPEWKRLLALAALLLAAQAWFELNMELVRIRLDPRRYGKLAVIKSAMALAAGALLAYLGFGVWAPLTGLLAAYVLTSTMLTRATWKGISPVNPDTDLLQRQLRYGLPLTVTFALSWIVAGSDRFLLVWLADAAVVGVYSSGYDLTFHSVTLVLTVVNTAAFPLAINALEAQGVEAARKQVERNGELVVAVALVSAAGLVSLGSQVVDLMIGSAYRVEALRILPWLAVAAVFAGIKAYHFDIAFHLGRDSRWLVITGIIAALTNIALNLLLIPSHGMLGAAWATLGAYAIAACSSAMLGARAFSMPSIIPITGKGVCMAVCFGLGAWRQPNAGTPASVQLVSGLLMGGTATLVAAYLVDFSGIRTAARAFFRRMTDVNAA